MTYADLPSEPGYGELLYCSACHGEYSAHASDYLHCDPSDVLKCYCGTKLILVRKSTRYTRIWVKSELP